MIRLLFFVCFIIIFTNSCTNLIITPGASIEGHTMISYAADSHTLYGALYHYPKQKWKKGSMIDITEWDTGKYLGQIKQVDETYNVVGQINEYQVTITETTFGGRSGLEQSNGKIDYGSLMWITLQRAKNAKDAINIMANLVKENGYHSSGESFSIGDKNEAWIMEMIGKGNDSVGAVWVALRIPDGYISSHANQARIRKFPLNDSDNCLYSEDVIEFAERKGWYSGKPEDFSFSDVYAPLTFGGARWCEARVWSFFNHYKDMSEWLDYAIGKDLENRMPLWIKPNRKLSLKDVQDNMRDHFEGTWFDMTKDWGAEPYQTPYRWRPMTYKVSEKEYTNERAVGTQQTGFSLVTEMRKEYPDPIGGIIWFGVDDTSTTVYCPFYCGITRIPLSHREEGNDIMKWNYDSAFWLFNLVAHFAYTRYDLMYPEIKKKIDELEKRYVEETAKVDKEASKLYPHDKWAAIDMLTVYSDYTGLELVKQWKELFGYLFTRYLDGDLKTSVHGEKFPKVETPGYSEEWYEHIVETSGDHFIVIEDENKNDRRNKEQYRFKNKGI